MHKAIITAIAALSLIAATPASAITLGIDDGSMVYEPQSPAPLLDAAQAHNAKLVRTITRPDRPLARYVALAEQARDRGMLFHATIDFSYGKSGEVSVDEFTAYLRTTVQALAATGVELRISVVNEADIFFPVAGQCTPDSIDQIIRSSGQRIVTSTKVVTKKVRKTKRVRYTVKKNGKRIVRYKTVKVSKRVKTVKRRSGKRIVTYRMVPVYVTKKVPVKTSTVVTSYEDRAQTVLTPKAACASILRARMAHPYIVAGINATRALAPSASIDGTETSPIVGFDVFVRELGRLGLPPIDGWAHHPYGGDVSLIRQVVTETFGNLPLDLTEFGIQRKDGDAVATEHWRAMGQAACSINARSLVAYQWQSENRETGWDTSLMDRGIVDTPQAQTFAAIAC